ncbi:MAG: Eco57I restriction-modification methylase domain-containing protein [Actinomycetota bacterium]|nr:Eco57I restriction-modification methylase domain-containing protein [Actinomycetota bacterium]MDA8278746.1 Eco57I restriction-modification methylase domain-containing protein [Actinomycetota bacterium]
MNNDLLTSKGPDILEVISDLSSDEVFTPPRVVTQVLDLLPKEVWSDSSLRWLDPGCKTGVFLREVTSRLMSGLTGEIPYKQRRLQHILQNQVFGIAITELTSMMSRRTLYCSKDASGDHSVVKMPARNGNIWFDRVEHKYVEEKCQECSAAKSQMERENRDNYAYAFIHEVGRIAVWKELGMKFDVIVGNPPYQMESEGSNRTIPIYNLFVEEAIKLNPKYMAMIIPSRWMAGGLGLSSFRSSMLSDKRIRSIVDFPNPSEVFPGVEIKAGVCYFMWERDHPGDCMVTTIRGGELVGPTKRVLDEYDVFVRDARALTILEKVLSMKEPVLAEIMSARTAFGIVSNYRDYSKTKRSGDVRFYATSSTGRVEAWIAESEATTNREAINTWKAMVPKAGSDGGQKLPDIVLGQPWIAEAPSICTQSFIFIGVENHTKAESIVSYYRTRFLRFLVSLRKITQDTTRETYTWVPQQTWDRTWTDEELYKKYGINEQEQAFIESMVKEMP